MTKLVQGPHGPVAVFDVAGETLAVDELCTHRAGPLSDGVVENGCVTCPWHGSVFELRTGAVAKGPAKRSLRCYDARGEGDAITVEVRLG